MTEDHVEADGMAVPPNCWEAIAQEGYQIVEIKWRSTWQLFFRGHIIIDSEGHILKVIAGGWTKITGYKEEKINA